MDAPPAQVTITFSQEIQKVTGAYGISVTDAGGTEFTSGAATVDDANRTRMSAPLQPLPPGRYVASWKNVSDADGDPAEGAFSFYVGIDPTDAERALDDELAGAMEEETPAASPSAAVTAPAAAPTAAPPDTKDDDDSGGNGGVWVAVVAAGAGVAIGFGAVRWFSSRRR